MPKSQYNLDKQPIMYNLIGHIVSQTAKSNMIRQTVKKSKITMFFS